MSPTPVAMVREAWHRLETWCRQYHPKLLDALAPGATREEIDSLEETIGQRLPDDLRESLAIHNGDACGHGANFLFGMEFHQIEDIRVVWNSLREFQAYNEEYRKDMSSYPEQAIALDCANDGWLAMSSDAGGNYLGVDIAPEPKGTLGQVINFGRDEREKCVLSSSWGEFLLSYSNYLESGVLTKIYPEVDDWYICFEGLIEGHVHDVLVRWTREGKWPLPRRVVTIDPDWRTETVLALARRTADDNDAERMPILGDALQDAGCTDEEILEHCRFCGTNVVGCWLLAALLEAS